MNFLSNYPQKFTEFIGKTPKKIVNLMSKKEQKQAVSVEIDRLTNSIIEIVSGKVCETEFAEVSPTEINREDWLFDWKLEIKGKGNAVFKMTTIDHKNIIQGLVSLTTRNGFVFVNLVENAKFNKGREKRFEGVGGNLFAFACKHSNDLGFGGCISFISKSSLIEYYCNALGAISLKGQRMVIMENEAQILINRYFKNC